MKMRTYDLHTICDQLEVMLRAPEGRWYHRFCHRHSEAKHLDRVECYPFFEQLEAVLHYTGI